MKWILKALCIFLQFICVHIFANANADSLLQIIKTSHDEKQVMVACNDYAFQQYRIQTDSGIYYANKALEIALRLHDENEISGAYSVLGLTYQIKGLFNLSLDNFKKALQYNQEDKSDMGRVTHNMALTYKMMRKNSDALQSELNALQFVEQANDSLLLGTIYQTICNIYRDLGEYEKAETYIQKALEITEASTNYGINNKASVIATIYSDYGNLLQASGQIDKAIEMHKRSIEMHEKSEDLYNKAISYENLGDDYMQLKRYADAINNYGIAKDIMYQVESTTDVGYEFLKIASAFKESGNYKGAQENADSAIYLFSANFNDNYRMDGYKLKYEIYDLQKNAAEALYYYKKYNGLKDSLDLKAQQNELIRLKTEYETTQKEQEIDLLKAENTLKEKEKQEQIFLRNIAIMLIGLLLIFGLMIRNRLRTRQQIKQLQMRNNIAMDLHDEVGSSLSAIKMMSEIASTQQDNKLQLKEILGKIVNNASETAEKMHDIIWMINPKQDKIENITSRMERFLAEMCAPHQIRFEFVNEYGNDLILNMQQRKNILLIFKEAVNNAVKYAEAEFIYTAFIYKQKTLILIIRDNGKGFDISTIKPGNGLTSMQQRAAELKGKLSVNSQPAKGTEVELEIKL